ncbi:hypothetical protein D9619_003824 [Psilocybe cf. subviscida]|uniref:Uncharacterized protein n=1 Tax=Psilocybe cf. subviscida TaxID=2480587 RepID=A0A8H5AWE6_9AGAR|nr:hypothetical protein D9619_003824 [Psilocybe cf. subviscida]
MLSNSEANPWAPFSSEREYRFSEWAKLRGPGSAAVSELLAIPGIIETLELSYKNANELNKIIDEHLPASRPRFQRHKILMGGEVCNVFFRNILECIKALYGDPELAQYMMFALERHYTDENMTCTWPSGGRQHKRRSRRRHLSAYPVYLTIGNIPKEICRKPSKRAYVLLGYLPTTQLEGITNQSQCRQCLANLYHACMRHILKPLEKAGVEGVYMSSGDGLTRRCHPLLASVIGDYLQQVLATCTYTRRCATCTTPNNEFSEFLPSGSTDLHDLDAILAALDSFEIDPSGSTHAAGIMLEPGQLPKPLHASTWATAQDHPGPIMMHQLWAIAQQPS